MEYRSATTAARSEKNLKRAEEWGIKALESPECDPVNDGRAPYFLATEVYLKQKNYIKMAEMLDIAEERNIDQLLETPFKLGDTPVTTIGEGVLAYRDQEWVKIFNKAVGLIQREKIEDAKKQIEIAILLHPSKGENYSTLAAIHLKNENMNAALTTVNRGLEVDGTNSMLYELEADILLQVDSNAPLLDEQYKNKLILLFKSAKEGNDVSSYDLIKNIGLDITNYSLEEFVMKLNELSEDSDPEKPNLATMKIAEESYLKAIKYSDDSGPVMRKLLFVYIDMGDNQKAIDYANELLNKYPNDANLYYNVGVLYQRLAKDIQIRSKENFNRLNEMDSPPGSLISQVYLDFREVRKYANNAKDFFYEASDLEKDENLDTKHAISEMKSAMDQMDDIFIPSIRKIAKSAGVELN